MTAQETSTLHDHQAHAFTGQKAAVLNLLGNHRGNWTPAATLARLGLQYSAPIKELRDACYLIENRATREGGKVHGAFRLVSPPSEMIEEAATVEAAEAPRGRH